MVVCAAVAAFVEPTHDVNGSYLAAKSADVLFEDDRVQQFKQAVDSHDPRECYYIIWTAAKTTINSFKNIILFICVDIDVEDQYLLQSATWGSPPHCQSLEGILQPHQLLIFYLWFQYLIFASHLVKISWVMPYKLALVFTSIKISRGCQIHTGNQTWIFLLASPKTAILLPSLIFYLLFEIVVLNWWFFGIVHEGYIRISVIDIFLLEFVMIAIQLFEIDCFV